MDKLIIQFPFERRNGLCYCAHDGVAYQPNMSRHIPYDANYFRKYLKYEIEDMGRELNRARIEIIEPWAKGVRLIDIGIGCGTFLKAAANAGLDAVGYDINTTAINWLKNMQMWTNPYRWAKKYLCWTFWDSLEHLSNPGRLLEKIPVGAFVFVSMPIFERLEDVEKSKHYRPNEHFYYFTQSGFLRWMRARKFNLIKIMDFETKIGRENIKTYKFQRMAKLNFKKEIINMFY